MAEDILGILTSSYKSISSNMNNITNNERLTNDGYLNMSGNWSEENKKYREHQNEILKSYREQLSAIKNIGQEYKNLNQNIKNLAAENYLFQAKHEEDLAKNKLNNYKQLYNYINDKDRKLYKQLDEEEANIYKTAIENKRSLTDEEIKQLENIEKRRLQSEENVKKEKLKTLNTIKDKTQLVIKELTNFANEMTDVFFFNQAKKGMTDFVQVYEQNFTELAGRLGTNRSETTKLLGNGLSFVNNDNVLSKALNYSSDVVPAILSAVQQGFLGEEAIEVGITNALDKKLMPWLNTSSETWSYLQFTMSEDALNSIKSQQLLLQATREGNRLLQTGIISTLTDQFAPLLSSIEINTTSKEDLGQFYAIAQAQLGDNAPESLIKETAKSMYNAIYKPMDALNSNKNVDKLRAIGYMRTGSAMGMEDYLYNSVGKHMEAMGDNRIALGAWFNMLGIDAYAHTQSAVKQTFTPISESSQYPGFGTIDDLENIYNSAADNAVDKVTATQAYDNQIQNDYAEKILEHLETPHASDIQVKIFDEVVNIKQWLITSVGATLLSGKLNNIIDKIGGKLLNTGANTIGSDVLTTGTLSAGSKKLIVGGSWTASAIGALAGGIKGYHEEANDAEQFTALMLQNKEKAQDTEEYNRYKNSLKDIESYKKTGAVAGGVIGGTAGVIGGGLAGAKVGTAIGTAIAPGIGTAVGMALGAGIGFIGGYAGSKIGGAIADATAPFNEALSDAAVKSLDSITVLQTNWDSEILERQNLVDAMKTATDTETKKRLLLDAGFDRNIVSAQKTSDALDNLAQSALDAAKDNGELANAAKGLILNANQSASAGMFNELWGKLKDGKTGEERREGLKNVLNMVNMNSDTRKAIESDIDNSWWWGTSDEDVQTILTKIQNEADNDEMMAIAGSYKLHYDTASDKYMNKLNSAIASSNKEVALDAIKMLNSDTITSIENGKTITTNMWENIKHDEYYNNKLKNTLKITKKDLEDKGINTDGYKLGSSYIPYDMLAMVHAGERVLTEGQNKKYTEELVSGNSSSSIIQAGVQDIVVAIKTQTSEIINYLSTMSFNNSSFGNSQLNMLPSMGNTKVTI